MNKAAQYLEYLLKHRLILLVIMCFLCFWVRSQGLRNTKIDGYRGIWFELNQKFEYGKKYSGGLGTYTAKHRPMAIYAEGVNKTFFVFGGTTNRNERHLLNMIGSFDHHTGMVSKPVVVYDKLDVNDPHDNPSVSIDDEGYIRVFVSGRSTLRNGIKLKSNKPFNTDSFTIIQEEEFTYPQIWFTEKGFFHFFTRYTGIRELYFETSKDGYTWSNVFKLAGIKGGDDQYSGHYQLSDVYHNGEVIGTFFNRHINGNPDKRTDLYYIQTKDFGKSWSTAAGNKIVLPLTEINSSARIINYTDMHKNVYLKDMDFDRAGNPVCLYITSKGHEPGPKNAPYTWRIVFWRDKSWQTVDVCESDHNYDMGSLFIADSIWQIVAPTENPPQQFGVGGEIAIWKSTHAGINWEKDTVITSSSELNHAYIRRPENFKSPFCFFWASGNPYEISISELYFGDFEGNVWKLPYEMQEDFGKPLRY